MKVLLVALVFICIGSGVAAAALLQQDLEKSAGEAIAAKRFQEARELYSTLSATHPERTDYILWVGRLSGWLHDYETAIAAFDEALGRNSRDSDALIGKAYILKYQQRYQAAEELLDRVLTLEPNSSEARKLKAEITPRRFEMVVGYGQDRFSFASPAHVGTVSIGYVGIRNRAAVQHESWNKFGDVAHRSGFSLSHRFERPLWIRGGMMLAPGARVLARYDYTGGFAYSLAARVVLSTDYRHMRFDNAVVHVVSPAVEYYFEKPIWLQASIYQAWTDYAVSGHPIAGSRSFSIRYNQQLSEAVLLHLGYARGNESFSALSVDRLGKFEANTFTTAADFKISPSYVTGIFYSYQKRSMGLEQSSVGVSLTLRK